MEYLLLSIQWKQKMSSVKKCLAHGKFKIASACKGKEAVVEYIP